VISWYIMDNPTHDYSATYFDPDWDDAKNRTKVKVKCVVTTHPASPSRTANIAMVVLFDNSVLTTPPSSSTSSPQSPSSSSSHILPPLPSIPPLSQSIAATDRVLPRSAPSRRRPPPATKDLQSKINLLDLPTETTATIFRYAHKPKDFHYLLPSGAGPLTLRAYNLPLTVSKEWYRRARPIYYETLRLTWRRIPDFVESVQRYDGLGRCISGVHVKISGKSFYKVIKGGTEDGVGGASRYSNAQLCLLIGQYIDIPLATFALCLGTLACVKDLTLRFTDCKGSEVSLQSNPCSCAEYAYTSYCFDCGKFTFFGAEFLFGLCYGSKTICNKSVSSSHLSNHSKKRNKSQINVPLMSISSPFQNVPC